MQLRLGHKMKTLDLAVMDEAQAQETVLIINRTQTKKVPMPKTTFEEKMARWKNAPQGKNKWELDLLQIEASQKANQNGEFHG